MERANFVNIISKLFFKHKAIISERTIPSESFKKGLKRIEKLLLKVFYPFADHIVVNSQGIKDDLISNFHLKESKISVIYNFIDLKKIMTLSVVD